MLAPYAHNQSWHVPAALSPAAAAPTGSLTAQADGRFVVEPTQPDDSLFALLRTADACLGRPVERIGAMLSNIVGKLLSFGPVVATAHPLHLPHLPLWPADESDADVTDDAPAQLADEAAWPGEEDRGLTAATATAIARIPITVEMDPGRQPVTAETASRLRTIDHNLRDSLAAAATESARTAAMLTRALGELSGIKVFHPDFTADALAHRLRSMPATLEPANRTLRAGHLFEGKHLAGPLVTQAQLFLTTRDYPDRLSLWADNAAAVQCQLRLTPEVDALLQCLADPDNAPACTRALALAAGFAHRAAITSENAPAALRDELGEPRWNLDIPTGSDATVHLVLTFTEERHGPIWRRFIPSRIGIDHAPLRPVTAAEASLAHAVALTFPSAQAAVTRLVNPRSRAADGIRFGHLLWLYPRDLIVQRCPEFFTNRTAADDTGTRSGFAGADQTMRLAPGARRAAERLASYTRKQTTLQHQEL